MGWSGSWNNDRTVFTGTFTAADGSVFKGSWTPPPGSSDPSDPPAPSDLSDNDPFVGPGRIGPRVDDSDSTRRSG
jgi:hypothetical protein